MELRVAILERRRPTSLMRRKSHVIWDRRLLSSSTQDYTIGPAASKVALIKLAVPHRASTPSPKTSDHRSGSWSIVAGVIRPCKDRMFGVFTASTRGVGGHEENVRGQDVLLNQTSIVEAGRAR